MTKDEKALRVKVIPAKKRTTSYKEDLQKILEKWLQLFFYGMKHTIALIG